MNSWKHSPKTNSSCQNIPSQVVRLKRFEELGGSENQLFGHGSRYCFHRLELGMSGLQVEMADRTVNLDSVSESGGFA